MRTLSHTRVWLGCVSHTIMARLEPYDESAYLFTQDSFYTEFQTRHEENVHTKNHDTVSTNAVGNQDSAGIILDNMQILLNDLDVGARTNGRTIYLECSSDMSISTDSNASQEAQIPSNFDLSETTVATDTVLFECDSDAMDLSSTGSLDSLSEHQEEALLRNTSLDTVHKKNASLRDTLRASLSRHTHQVEYHDDILGTYNIQNKYEHSIATQLFLAGGFTFLALQEPFASHDKTPDSWKACRKNEVESARLCC